MDRAADRAVGGDIVSFEADGVDTGLIGSEAAAVDVPEGIRARLTSAESGIAEG